MKQTIIAALMSAALLFAAPAAFAQEEEKKENNLSGGYIGIAGGLFDEDSPPAAPGYEYTGGDDAGVFRLYGGYLWEHGAALEASLNGIADLKLDCSASGGGQQTIERGSFSVAGLYHFRFGRLSFFPKLGMAYAEVDSGNDSCVTYSDDSTFSVVYGGGVEFRATDSVALRADIDKGTSGLDDENFAWSAGLSFYF